MQIKQTLHFSQYFNIKSKSMQIMQYIALFPILFNDKCYIYP